MANSAGLSTVSELVKQASLYNNQQYSAAKQGLEFAETAVKSTKLSYTSQQNKLENSLRNGVISKDDYDKQIEQMKRQYEIDCAPWELYIQKLRVLVQQYSSKCPKKRDHDQSSSKQKRARMTFSSTSSSDSDTPPPIKSKPIPSPTVKYDSSTNTDPLELSLRSSFSSTPNVISFTSQTKHVTERVSPQHVNEIAAKQIVLLHDEGHLVRWNDVIWRILTYFHVQDLGNLGIHRADHIPCIDNLIRTQNKINIYIDAYIYWQSMGTLNELETDLAHLFHKNDYHELLMGPIEKQPKIQQLFGLKILGNDPIKKDLKSADVLKYLDQYMTKKSVWKNENDIDMKDFFQFIAKEISVKNLSQLGIRMKSVYFARSSIKAMQANQRKTMETARNELNRILDELAQKEVKKVLETVHEKLDDQRKIYARMQPLDIINDLVEVCREICHNYSSFRKISQALQVISDDPSLRNIFQIAICQGHLTVPDSTTASKECSTKTKATANTKIYFDSSDSEEESAPTSQSAEPTINHPDATQILHAFKEQLNGLESITFASLAHIERRVCERFQVNDFHQLGQGTFLHFIQQHESTLFSKDAKFHFASSSNCDDIHPTAMVAFEDLEQLILQARHRSIEEKYLEEIICYHYQIESFEQLGYGSYRSVMNTIRQNNKSMNLSIHYECLMFDEMPLLEQRSKLSSNQIDIQRQALDAIDQCPLLANLHLDTQWNLRFRPRLGPLKSFLSRHAIQTLEIDSTTLLKVSSNSTIDLLKQSLDQFDSISTSGHLVSILVQHGSLAHAPLSLLTNIIHNFFSSASLDHRLYDFLIAIFMRIPFLLLLSFIQRIFFAPLIILEGSQTKVREFFWKTINHQHPDTVLRFVQLGQHLGFTDWAWDNIKSEPIVKTQQEKPLPALTPIVTVPPTTSIVKLQSGQDKPYDVIEQIRREKFGIGLNLSIEGQFLTDQLKSLIGRSLERLSKELYNTDMHFVLELIQNADDNEYTTKPCLTFVIDSNEINIYNNESGFEEQHIQALCDIGKSTKGKHKQGYIGQKGIGFKSVFTICDRPEIYSNGYQVCFDARQGTIGYILPNWIVEEKREEEYVGWPTRISLPLKSETEMQKHQARSLTESFNDLHPSLLLFLNRLRSITIDNRVTNTKQIFQRFDIPGTNIVEIHCRNSIEKWFIIKKQLIIPDEIKTSLDAAVEATEIALAFPLHPFTNERTSELIKQDVYAYLPLRTFGFTFIIQADFEVPSSRQDILSDSLWNQFLLNEIPTLFLSSLQAFQQQRSFLPIDPLRLFLHFLPNETAIHTHHLFTPVCRKILQSLRSYPFLPVINDEHFHRPNECILVNDASIKEILTPEILFHHLHLYYLRDEFDAHEKQLYELGVHGLDHQQLIEMIKRIFTSEISFENKRILAKWFGCLQRCLKELSRHEEQQVIREIQGLKIFPLKYHQEFVALRQCNQPIFFPVKNLSLPELIEQDLLIIEDDFWDDVPQDQSLFERLGIQHLTHKTICEQHIFPTFEDEYRWKEKSPATLIAYVTYIYELWSKQAKTGSIASLDLTRLKSIIQLSTNDGFKQPIHHSIHFTPTYGNPYDLPNDFPGYRWILLSDDYIRSTKDRKKLHQFFSELGVVDFLFPMSNFTSEQLHALIEMQSITINRKLFSALQEHWSEAHEILLPFLREAVWVPKMQITFFWNKQTDQIESKKIDGLDKPNHIYLKTKQIQRIFGVHVPYIDVEIDPNSSFAHDLGLIGHVTSANLLSALYHWCESSIFYTSISHIQSIYEYLHQNIIDQDLRELIHHKKIFFVPFSTISDRTEIVGGRFVGFQDVCWSDPTNLFTKYSSSNRFILEPYYTEQRSIFLESFAVPLNPTMDEYIHLLVRIASLKMSDETIEHAFLTFKILGTFCQQSISQIEKPVLQHKSIFPTKDRRWISLHDNLFISDDDDLAQLFIQMNNISLIELPSTDSSSVTLFFQFCGIHSLSSSITIEHIVDNPTSDGQSIQNLLSPLIPYIQLFMKSRPEFTDAYQRAKSIDLPSILLQLQFQLIDDLQLIYRLKFDSSISVMKREKSYYDSKGNIFYFPREWIEQSKHHQDIFHSFARLFIPNHNHQLIRLLGNFLTLLYHEEENNLDNFARYQQFDLELKDMEEIPWLISSTAKPISRPEPKIDDAKVRSLLKDVAENSAQQQKKRKDFQKQLSFGGPRLDQIPSKKIPSNLETSYEPAVQRTKKFNLEDLTHQALNNRHSAIGSNDESLKKIGQWGEKWVNEYLHTKYQIQIQSKEIEIIWLNEELEQGKPYDFILRNLQTNQTNYIEVKSTLSADRQLIPITFNELHYCCSLSDRNEDFQIYRVYNTGQLKKVKLHIVDNVEEKIRKHLLELFLLI